MNTQKVLLGALLAQPDLAPYSLPDLDVEHFAPDVQPVFAAVSGFWNSTGTLDAVQICERYPDLKTAVLGCFDEWSAECVRATRPFCCTSQAGLQRWSGCCLPEKPNSGILSRRPVPRRVVSTSPHWGGLHGRIRPTIRRNTT